MFDDYWQKQTKDVPLYSDVLWDRPERQDLAGKLLILGGNMHAFAAPARSYDVARSAGIGKVRLVLPSSLRRIVGHSIPECEFVPSTQSGGLSLESLDTVLAMTQWADAVLVSGDIGRNSETTILLERLLQSQKNLVTITKDALDCFVDSPKELLSRSETLVVASFAQLQKIASRSGFTPALTFSMDLIHIIPVLHTFTLHFPIHLITRFRDQIIVASNGRVITQSSEGDDPVWRVETAARATVFWLQSPQRPLEAIASSLITH